MASAVVSGIHHLTAIASGAVEKNRRRYRMGGGSAPGRFLDRLCDPAAPRGRPGAGRVHHIAWRIPSDGLQRRLQAALRGAGFAVSEVRDRKYFRSIYFRELGGDTLRDRDRPAGVRGG